MTQFQVQTKVIMGENSCEQLKQWKGLRTWILCDPFLKDSKILNSLINDISDDTANVAVFSDVVPDPDFDVIVKGLRQMEEFDPDQMIAIGGGSAIDSGKLIRYFYQENIAKKDKTIRFIAIPTTSGTGSEVTSFSVITDREKQRKYPLIHEKFIPDIAILNPNLTVSVPEEITADTGMDVLTHAIEAYVSKNANDFTDALAEKAVVLVMEYLELCVKYPKNKLAREKLQNAACISGAAFNIASLGMNHAMAHALGAEFHISHGRSNAILLPHVTYYQAEHSKKAEEGYCRLAKLLRLPCWNSMTGAKSLIREITELNKRIGIEKRKLPVVEDGDFRRRLEIMAEKAIADPCMETSPVKLEKRDAIELFEKSLKPYIRAV